MGGGKRSRRGSSAAARRPAAPPGGEVRALRGAGRGRSLGRLAGSRGASAGQPATPPAAGILPPPPGPLGSGGRAVCTAGAWGEGPSLLSGPLGLAERSTGWPQGLLSRRVFPRPRTRPCRRGNTGSPGDQVRKGLPPSPRRTPPPTPAFEALCVRREARRRGDHPPPPAVQAPGPASSWVGPRPTDSLPEAGLAGGLCPGAGRG